MRIANLAESTRYAYVLEVEHLAKHYKASPADLDAEQVRAWVLTLIDKGLSPSSTNATLSALRLTGRFAGCRGPRHSCNAVAEEWFSGHGRCVTFVPTDASAGLPPVKLSM